MDKNDKYPEKLQSVFWEDMEAKEDKTANDLIACDSQCVYIWDVQHGSLSESAPKYTVKCADLSCSLITGSSSVA